MSGGIPASTTKQSPTGSSFSLFLGVWSWDDYFFAMYAHACVCVNVFKHRMSCQLAWTKL